MEHIDIYGNNLVKIYELQEGKQWAVKAWMDRCWELKLYFRILEAYRSPSRQLWLYSQGRTRPGRIVTWTLASNHVQRLAFDVQPINCSYEQLENVAHLWVIDRPDILVEMGDLGHFEVLGVGDPPRPVEPPEVQLKKKENALKFQRNNPLRKNALLRAIDRLKRIIEGKREG